MKTKRVLVIASLAAMLAAAGFAIVLMTSPAGASAAAAKKTYILTSGTWGPRQTAAVFGAGGDIVFVHKKTGLAVATSAFEDFASRALSSGAFQAVARDQVVRWQPPVTNTEFEASAVTPGNETFINFQWNIPAVEAQGAWAAGWTGLGVRVAVIDGGIYDSHLDLAGQVDVAASKSFYPDISAFNTDTGTFWHATHVAGIIAAKDNNMGTIGVAPGATIIGVKVLHDGSGPFSSIIQGILYASTPQADGGAGADIINMSLGAVFPKGGGNTGAGILVAALNKAVNYAAQNTLVVCSAGNDELDLDHSGSYVSVPAMSGQAIAVSATGPLGYAVGWPDGATNFRRPASYTNYGNSLVWLAAPGGDFALPGSALCTLPRAISGTVTNPCWVFDMVMSCIRGSGASISSYSWAAGTSMAAPHVSAIAALAMQRFPGISVGALKTLLARTADDEGKPGHDPYYGRGFVNARRAVTE